MLILTGHHSKYFSTAASGYLNLSCGQQVKRITSILLIACLFIFESGYMALYLCRLAGLKEEMQVYIRDHAERHGNLFSFNLTDGKVSDQHFKWEEEGKEFRYQGKMYDVVSMKLSAGELVVHAFNDQQEEQLMAQLKLHHQQKDNPALTELISLVFESPSSSYCLQLQTGILKHSPQHFVPAQPSIILGVQSPPPDMV